MNIFTKRSLTALVAGSALIGSFTLASTAFAADNGNSQGHMNRGSMMGDKKGIHRFASSTPPFIGNGQPIVGGKVTAVSGNTLTVTNASNVTYTIDATSAKIIKAGIASPTIATIVVGDSIIVQGAVNGTTVTAATVVDQGTRSSNNENGSESAKLGPHGFFGAVGGFFARLFGF